jgi:hypothetical protein
MVDVDDPRIHGDGRAGRRGGTGPGRAAFRRAPLALAAALILAAAGVAGPAPARAQEVLPPETAAPTDEAVTETVPPGIAAPEAGVVPEAGTAPQAGAAPEAEPATEAPVEAPASAAAPETAPSAIAAPEAEATPAAIATPEGEASPPEVPVEAATPAAETPPAAIAAPEGGEADEVPVTPAAASPAVPVPPAPTEAVATEAAPPPPPPPAAPAEAAAPAPKPVPTPRKAAAPKARPPVPEPFTEGPPVPKQDWAKVKNPVAATEASINRGRELYNGKGLCNVCHGDKGDGFGPVRGQFDPYPNAFLDPAWQKALNDGRMMGVLQDGKYGTAMVRIVPDFLTETEAWDVINYVRTFSGKTTEAYERYQAYLKENPDAAVGAATADRQGAAPAPPAPTP